MKDEKSLIYNEIMEKTCRECRIVCTKDKKTLCFAAFRTYAGRKALHKEIEGRVRSLAACM